MTFPIANYTGHRDALAALLQQPCGKPVLLIKGEKDHGKTWLLKWFRTELGDNCRLLKFDLAAPEQLLSPALILRKCSDELGNGNFPKFEQAAQVHDRTRVAIVRDVQIQGNYNTVKAEVGTTPEEQLMAAIELTKFFVGDLKAMAPPDPPIVFAFDHVESTTLLTRNWLFQSLIPALRSVPQSRVVLAATQFPALDDEVWEPASTVITLTGITEPAAWHSLVKLLKKNCPIAKDADPNVFLQGLIVATGGIPGSLMPFINKFPAET